jgi:hypothetical protein
MEVSLDPFDRKLLRSIKSTICSTSGVVQRDACADLGSGVVPIFIILKVTEDETTVLRYENASGEDIGIPVLVACT